MSLEQNLREMERSREAYWLRYPSTAPVKLRWRALAVRHSFHVVPGETILELGAGSGLWTEHLTSVLRGENPITAAVFNDDFERAGSRKGLPNTRFLHVKDLLRDLPAESFDYVVGTAILCHNKYEQNLQAIHRVLKPGGQIFFFEANYWNPQVFVKEHIRPVGRWSGQARSQIGMRRYRLMQKASRQGFTHVEVIPYDIVHSTTPRWLIPTVQSIGIVLEHTGLIRELCGTLYIWAKKPGDEHERRPRVNLATHRELFGTTSVVIPCHNEEMNIRPLVDALLATYDDYIHEIIIVNDNSTDRTADVAREIAAAEPRVRLVDRPPPPGVGRALRDGYAAATGNYILTMDSDFVQIVPELRDLFDAVAAGHEGAIGSRFSHDSMLINYPFLKIICNRGFHILLNMVLRCHVRDISNNLKLYRAEILKGLEIEQTDFAANVETGLKPLLAGYDVQEVPISWINRTSDMGSSSFKILRVAPNYFLALVRMVTRARLARWRVPARAPANSVPVLAAPFTDTVAMTPTNLSTVERVSTTRNRLDGGARPVCPLCASADTTVYVDAEDETLVLSALGPGRTDVAPGRILRCRACSLGFRQVRATDERLAELYQELNGVLYEAESLGRLHTAVTHLRIVHRYRAPGRLLDVGCATGLFLRCAVEAGWEVVGVEPGRTLCAKANETLNGRGDVICSTLQKASLPASSFDVVTLWDVLEHVADIRHVLGLCASLLKPGGHLFVNVPDLDSLQARVLRRRWPLLLPEHLNYFNRRSLEVCARIAKLRWIGCGRRRASFSLAYVLYRLAQHRLPGASIGQKLTNRLGVGGTIIRVPLGELYGVLAGGDHPSP